LVNDRYDLAAITDLLAADPTFFADHGVVLVVGVVGIAQAAVRSYFEFQKLVAKLSLVANVIPAVEIVRHDDL